MSEFINRFRHDYRAAPLWQKLLLLLLLAGVFFFIVIRPAFLVHVKQINVLESERKQLVSHLQLNKMLVRDAAAIEKNAKLIQEARSVQVLTLPQLKMVLASTLRKHTRLVLQCDYNAANTLDYGLVAAIPVVIKVNIVPVSAEPLLTSLLDIGFGQVRSIEYVNQVLTMEILYLYTKKNNGTKFIQKQSKGSLLKQKTRIEAIPQIQGFFTQGGSNGVICNNRVYYVGAVVGKYTILKIQPTLRQVVFGYKGKSITVRK